MKYKEIEGDLLYLFNTGEFAIIAHGCNCFNEMNGGIAKQIAAQFPDACFADKYYHESPLNRLGNYSTTEDETIINLYTQYCSGKNLDYEALTLSLRKLNIHFEDCGMSLGLPQIGCGIAGGDWEIVKKIIKKELTEFDVTVVIYKEK